jgi:hypothetical protein
MRRLAYLVTGLAAGLFAGWLLFGHPADSNDSRSAPAQPASPSASLGSPVISPPSSSGDAGGIAGRIIFRPRYTEPPRPEPEVGPPADEVAYLRERVSQLERKAAAEDVLLREKEGVPIKAPEHLDARFDQEKVRGAVNAGLKEVGLDGEVTAVDCSEYPCLAVGEIKGASFGREEAGRVGHSAALSAYTGDSRQSLGTSVEDNGHLRNLFGVAVYPKAADDAEQQQIAKRLHYRFGEIQGLQ